MMPSNRQMFRPCHDTRSVRHLQHCSFVSYAWCPELARFRFAAHAPANEATCPSQRIVWCNAVAAGASDPLQVAVYQPAQRSAKHAPLGRPTAARWVSLSEQIV